MLPTRLVDKPWGRDALPAPFVAPPGARIGEIWFEPTPELPQLLAKYIFTSEKLSVQVHPSDAQTLAAGLGRQGKEECWLVLDAEPGATLGVGLNAPGDAESLRAAALDGGIEALLQWHPVRAGDFFYIPANTIHAIGAGIALVEVQQNSDITYRLYDYGRPRELHLDEGLAVAQAMPHDAGLRRNVPESGGITLVEGPYFRLDRLDGPPDAAVQARYRGACLILPLQRPVRIGADLIGPGDCAGVANLAEADFRDAGRALVAQAVQG